MFPSRRECGTGPTSAEANGDIFHLKNPPDVQNQDGAHMAPATTGTTPTIRIACRKQSSISDTARGMPREIRLPNNCGRCGDAITQHSFHCGACSIADYDLCPRCFSKGLHCLDKDHKMRERAEGMVEERICSDVKENGQREMSLFFNAPSLREERLKSQCHGIEII